ncbi:MAG TPA: hypothetical protein QGF58_18190 [Myxococcota bacterium]|jgi:hypothetical protein|nr:hypothetical protein [Myxococcota bacterium]
MTPDCDSLSVEAGDRRYLLHMEDHELLVEDGPRTFRFERDGE